MNYDILLRFILDEASKQKTKAGVGALNEDLDQTEKHVHDINQAGHDSGLIKAMDAAAKVATEKLNPALAQSVKHQNDLAAAAKRASAEASTQARIFSAQATILSNQVSQARARSEALSRASSVIGRASGVGLAVGGAVVGGILAEANRYAKEVEGTEKATQATREWSRATKELGEARSRVDAVLLKEALPLLQQAAKVASQAAGFIEKHPQIVSAALNLGVVVAGLSAVGLAVSKGIKFYADQLYLSSVPVQLHAAELQAAAAEQQLIAAQLQAEARGIQVAENPGNLGGGRGAAGKIGGAIGTVAIAASAAYITFQSVDFVLGKLGQPKLEAMFDAQLDFLKRLPDVLKGNIKLNDLAAEVVNAARATVQFKDALNDATTAATGGRGGRTVTRPETAANRMSIETQGALVDIWTKWKDDDARIVAEAAATRLKIVTDSEKKIASETAKYSSQVATINTNARKREDTITSGFLKQTAKEEADYQKQRAAIIKDSGEEIRDIEADHQERLRKLANESDDRIEDLTASRDALGLAKEKERFNEAQAEENNATRLEIAKSRQDIAQRLQELDEEHKAEQAQRLAQFKESLAENEVQRKEELKQAAEAHAEEMRQIRIQRTQQLRELQEGLNAERARRRDVFIAEIRDLDASLLGEKNLKARYYNLMLQDAEKFFAAYRAKLPGATATAPTHDYSGYAYSGMYKMAANGQREYVLSGAATRAAENIIGSGLTQDALLNALVRGANNNNNSRSLTINDNSRFDGRISASQVRAIKRETRDELIKEMF